MNINNSTLSPLTLPAEIRNLIWWYALLDGEPIDIRSPLPALLGTSKQARAEALAMYYYVNTFEFEPMNDGAEALRPLEKWFNRIEYVACGYLNRVQIVISSKSGALVKRPELDPALASSPWETLIERIKAGGWTDGKVQFRVSENWKLCEYWLKTLPSYGATEADIEAISEYSRRELQHFLTCFISLMALEKKKYEEWRWEEMNFDGLVARARAAVWNVDQRSAWDGSMRPPFDTTFSYSETRQALENFREFYQGLNPEQRSKRERGWLSQKRRWSPKKGRRQDMFLM